MFGLPITWIAIVLMGLGLAGSGWFILEQREALGEVRAQHASAVAASEANAEIAKWERADRERAQRIVARLTREKVGLEAKAAAEKEETYNVAPDQNGPIAAVVRRVLDRLPAYAGGGATDTDAPAGDRPGPTPADARPDAAGGRRPARRGRAGADRLRQSLGGLQCRQGGDRRAYADGLIRRRYLIPGRRG